MIMPRKKGGDKKDKESKGDFAADVRFMPIVLFVYYLQSFFEIADKNGPCCPGGPF